MNPSTRRTGELSADGVEGETFSPDGGCRPLDMRVSFSVELRPTANSLGVDALHER